MAESPSKRQRLSPDTRETMEDIAEEPSTDRTRPTTPKRRASYLSPTKASLARSHPHILAKSPKRGSLTEPRGRLLRQELLGSRKSVSRLDSNAESLQESISQKSRGQTPTGQPNELDKNAFADAVAQAFQNSVVDQPEELDNITAMRSPLLTRQPPNTVPNKRRRQEKDVSPTLPNFPVPTLVKRPDGSARQTSEARNEPDLPPTPVQLGIGILPDRPRGLASSSSIGSRSGSGRHRKRVRSGGSGVTSSPLKPKDTRPVSPIDFSDIEDEEFEAASVPPESDADDDENSLQQEVEDTIHQEDEDEDENSPQQEDKEQVAEMDHQDDVLTELSRKQKEGASLRSEVAQLRKDLALLESLTERLEEEPELDVDENEIELLKVNLQPSEFSLQSPDTHPLFVKNSAAYLELFASGNLQLKHETTPAQIHDRLKVDHRLTLSPPKPWPQHTLQYSFSIRVDAEESRIEEIVQIESNPSNEQDSLYKWIQSRLQDPLHQLNATGLIWGIGQYFQACEQRAQFFCAVDELYNQSSPPPRIVERSAASQDKSYLSRYFHETQITVVRRNASAKSLPKKVRVDYHIDLTWSGDTSVRVDMTLAGVNAQAQKAAKELFVKLLETEDVLPAFERVCSMLEIEAMGPRSDVGR